MSDYVVEEGAQGLKVTIRPRSQWSLRALLTIWMVGWLGGELVALYSLFQGASTGRLAWLALWTVAGAVVATVIAWNVYGCEVVDIKGRELELHRLLALADLTQRYDLALVNGLRLDPGHDVFDDHELAVPPYPRGWTRHGALAFDYGAKVVRFGQGLDETDARALLVHVKARIEATAAS
jgi:hypothetical protein